MSIYHWPHRIDFELRSAVPRPDGPVPLRIHGPELLRAAGASGHLDFRSLRIVDMNLFPTERGRDTVERDAVVQFVPEPGFHPVTKPAGILWFRLHKYPWEDKAFPRKFRLYFDTVEGGGKEAYAGAAEPKFAPVSMCEHVPGGLEWTRGASTILAYNTPWSGKPGFHPVTTPAGQVLTADRPCDHPWHHGVCIGWTSIECEAKGLKKYAFWGEPGSGVIYTSDVAEKHCGPVVSTFCSDSICCTHEGEPVFRMSLAATFQPADRGWQWLDIGLTLAAEDAPVKMASDYGHLKARMSLNFSGPQILDSNGTAETNNPYRKAVAVDWLGLSGNLPGGPASMLLLNHPSNPGGQPSGDGSVCLRDSFMDEGALFAWIGLNPFRIEPLVIEPGQPLTWRYRVVTSDRLLTPDFSNYQYQNWVTDWQIEGLP